MDLPNRDKEAWALVHGLLEKSLSGGLPEILKSTTELSGERIPFTICTLFITFAATIGNGYIEISKRRYIWYKYAMVQAKQIKKTASSATVPATAIYSTF